MKNPDSNPTPRQQHPRLLSALVALLCVAAVFIGSGLLRRQRGFSLGDFSGADVQALCQTYEQSGDVRDLITYLKALCYRAEVEQDETVTEEIARRGTTLLDLARAEEIDLEALGEADETLLELLRTIRSHGAK